MGLAFDWIGGNIYVATWGGHILACLPSVKTPINCFTVLSGMGALQGIALNPAEG